jgi:hypothetical protein
VEIKVEMAGTSGRFNESLFPNLAAAVRALRWRFKNVIRHARIRTGNAIEDVIKWNLGAIRIAVLSGVNQSLGLLQSCGVDEDNVCCSAVGSKKSCGMARILSLRAG